MKIVSIVMLIIALNFAYGDSLFETKANLKELEKTHKSYKQSEYKNYILGAEYYFGLGKEQNIKVAKDIFEKNSYDDFMMIYSSELEKLIKAEAQPNVNTGVELLSKSLEIYKKRNPNDTYTINAIDEMIKNWNQNIIIYSPNRKSRVIEHKADYLINSEYDGYARFSYLEIESPFGKVSFKDFYFGAFDFVKGYSFLDNQKLLIHLGSATASGVYMLDLMSFDMKLVDYGSLENIQTINSEKIITLSLKNYHDGGGAFWYDNSYDSNGIAIENKSLENFINQYTLALNSKDYDLIYSFYFNEIAYYRSKSYSKQNVMKDKIALLKKYPNFNMKSKIFAIKQETENDFTIIYRKNVIYGKNNRIFDSYFKVKIVDGNVFIKEENDIN